ncbi:glutamate synthase alpha subunit domain protein [Planctopirus limnophila DSM 3776]|uniref:Glutamate synthase alpha subunit domain protein n=1 Tax=Planctopirus limnophila (strain ATCC 43296 / DSM 3776 / IFAM 1008 / Mu 290) TaxID=521674 RepID=D5SVI5_PLAL2|nr:formylmethanofuran dehydrogenase subunit C [Planctopirus limnophila]ADG67255.1 glutamate synthase alpha subunit domain protein [Planctopirus limnophila DSM 3776]
MKLTLVQQPVLTLDFSRFFAELRTGMTTADLMQLPVYEGNRLTAAREWLACEKGDHDSIEMEGDLSRCDGLGHQWSHGELVIHSHCGSFIGSEMSGGSVIIHGDCGSDCGAAMKGGQFFVYGNAGDRLGGPRDGAMAGMEGGEILVAGKTGRHTGQFMRRGLIAACGTMGAQAGHGAIAGTIATMKGFGQASGFELKRATLISMSALPIDASFNENIAHPLNAADSWRYAGLISSNYLNLLFRRLHRLYSQFDHQLTEQWLFSEQNPPMFDRYLGDQLSIGHGEWLIARQM